MSSVRLESVSKHLGDVVAVDAIDLELAAQLAGLAVTECYGDYELSPFEDGHEILGIQTWDLDAYVDGARQ